MIQNKHIIPECFADTLLVESLGFVKPNHQKNISQVIKFSTNSIYRFSFGIIDDDKNKPPKLEKEFEKITETYGLRLYQRKNASNYLIVLKPAFEKWVLFAAEMAGVKPEDLNLPKDLKEFGKLTKRVNIGENKEFKSFLKKIIKENPPPVYTLKSWLNGVFEETTL